MSVKHNRGEWSELYAFIWLLKEGRIYAADEYVNRLEDIYYPILKIMRMDEHEHNIDYCIGDAIRIYRNNELVDEISIDDISASTKMLFNRIFEGDENDKGAFEIPEIDDVLSSLKISKIKAPAGNKADIYMQIHDVMTGYDPEVGFSIKSDVGMPPTLLNAGKNTRFKYEIIGITDADMNEINSIDKNVDKEYMKSRMHELFRRAEKVKYSSMLSETFEDNLMMIDSMLPDIYGEFILYHYKTMSQSDVDCETLCELIKEKNPLGYKKTNIYRYKIKKLLSASALGMTPGREWDGNDVASGGYIIVKRDGDVLCYHLYNRDFFEEYLLKNTTIDRPSASRYDYAYIYKENNRYYINLNIQIRFKSIKSSKKKADDSFGDRIKEYALKLSSLV